MSVRVWESTAGEQSIKIHVIPALKDNYVYVLQWTNQAIVIDPAEPGPVLDLVGSEELDVKAILITHHHEDHTAGVEAIKSKTDCNVIGPSDVNIDHVDQVVSDGEEIILGPLLIQVMTTPGHTLDHISYYLPDFKVLFCGDTIFAAGCGKIFEGTPKQLFESLQKLAKLPSDTSIFCGHEYTLNNLKFAASVEPDNEEVRDRIAQVERDGFGVPTQLDLEFKTNPFFRTNSPEIRKTLGLEEADACEVFTTLRAKKDSFSA